MSSEGNLLTGAYTEKCVEIAREHKDFVIGFIAQRSLNEEEKDNFLTMTPGVSLPPPGREGERMGDGLGQQYNTPRKIVLEQGADVIIVGRGILGAEDRATEAERYRKEAWAAYEERTRR
jgi:uridine monophosphate synthetase